MKFLKTSILFFCICSLLQMVSCSKKEALKPSETVVLDSVSVYSQKMKDPNLSDSVCLIYANKALQYATLHHQDTKISSILKHKTSLFVKG